MAQVFSEGSTPKVFISYSWDDDYHNKWVLELADKLTSNGVHVILDKYDLRLGHDMTRFMENGVANSDKVILIMTPNYKIKADNRKGGVGYEYSMVTQAIYDKQENIKFIPILRKGEPHESSPIFLKSLLALYMTNDSTFESDFTELLREIFNEPKIKRPPLGNKPNFISKTNESKSPSNVYNEDNLDNSINKAEKFIKQRIEKVRELKVFPELATTFSFFIHIVPSSFQTDKVLDLTKAMDMGLSLDMRPFFLKGWDTMFNSDGFVTWSGMIHPQIISYDQLFRNGIYEAYTSLLFTRNEYVGMDTINGDSFIKDVLDKINNSITVLRKFQKKPPIIIFMSLIGIKGGSIFSLSRSRASRAFLVNEIYLPSVLIPTYETNIYEQLKPNFDILWQSVSENESPPYLPKR